MGLWTFKELKEQHRGSKPPRERTIHGIIFYFIYRSSFSGGFWITEHNGKTAIVQNSNSWKTYHAIVDGNSLPTRFRNEDRALEAAAKALSAHRAAG